MQINTKQACKFKINPINQDEIKQKSGQKNKFLNEVKLGGFLELFKNLNSQNQKELRILLILFILLVIIEPGVFQPKQQKEN